MQFIIAASALIAGALAVPTPQVEATPYPSTDRYVITGLTAQTQRMSLLNEFKLNITLNENGANPYTTACAGASNTTPALTYLPWTNCSDSAVQFSWRTVNSTVESPGAFYELRIRDNQGYSGVQTFLKQAVKNVASGADTEAFPVWELETSETFEVARVLPVPESDA